VYYPGVTLAQVAASPVAPENYGIRTVVDLRESSVVEVELPFAPGMIYASRTRVPGCVFVNVLNTLRAPETCLDTITIALEVSLKNAEYAYPRTAPTIRPGIFDDKIPAVSVSTGYAAQGPCDIAEADEASPLEMEDDGIGPAEICIGERVLSLLQMVKCQNRIIFSGGNGYNLKPYGFDLDSINAGTGIVTTSTYRNSWMEWVCLMFAFMRGGVNIGVVCNSSTDTQVFASIQCTDIYQTNFNTSNPTEPTSTGRAFIYPKESGVSFFRIPYYSKTCLTPVIPNLVTTLPQAYLDQDNYAYKLGTFGVNAGQSTGNLWSAADDFQLIYFVGVPMLWL
jgi:hypothetical protein